MYLNTVYLSIQHTNTYIVCMNTCILWVACGIGGIGQENVYGYVYAYRIQIHTIRVHVCMNACILWVACGIGGIGQGNP